MKKVNKDLLSLLGTSEEEAENRVNELLQLEALQSQPHIVITLTITPDGRIEHVTNLNSPAMFVGQNIRKATQGLRTFADYLDRNYVEMLEQNIKTQSELPPKKE